MFQKLSCMHKVMFLVCQVTFVYQELELVLLKDDTFKPLVIALSRVIAAKPYSMDVERIVSSYNLVKSSDCSSLDAKILCNYLIVCHNMPCVADFDVRPGVQAWITSAKRLPCKNINIE